MNTAFFTKQTKKLCAVFMLLYLIILNSSLTSVSLGEKEDTKTPSGFPIESYIQYVGRLGDSCDRQKSADSERLFAQLTQAEKDNPGSILQDDLQSAALRFVLESERCYPVIASYQQVQSEPLYVNESGFMMPAYIDPAYLLYGHKWGIGSIGSPFNPENPPGTAGGTVTFSFMGDGVDLSKEPDSASFGNSIAITSLPTYKSCFLTTIRYAFTVWSAAANIDFVEVSDNGYYFDHPNAVGHIRIGAHTFDGPEQFYGVIGGNLAHAYHPPPSGNSAAGDLHFDREENWTCDTSGVDIGLVALHEIGHSIGLEHVSTKIAIMNETYNPSLSALQQDDIEGAQAIYGIRVDCPQSGGVILFWNANYDCTNNTGDAGYRQRTNAGSQNVNDGQFNDKASSVKIPSGWSVRLYNDANHQGGNGSICYNSDVNDFGTQGNFPGTNIPINDRVSSMEVFTSTDCKSPPITITPTPPTQPPGQWHAQYFSDHNWSSQRCQRNILGSGLVGADFSEDWGAGAPCIGMSTDNFSVRYTGSFSFGSAGTYWFKVHHDDGAILFIDGNVSQNWSGSGDDCPAITLSSGTHTLRLDYRENTGGASVGLEVRNSPCHVPPTHDPKQWHAEYFSDHNWSSRQCERHFDGSGIMGADFNENWDAGAPCPSMPTDNFSVRYTAMISVSSTRSYWFEVNHDDGARLNIDGEDLQNWTTSGEDCPERNLTAGTHTFRIDYRENTGSAHISLKMRTTLCGDPVVHKLSPTNGAANQPTNVTLTWEASINATSFEYCYDTVNDNVCSSSWVSTGATRSANLFDLSPNTYYWQVRGRNEEDTLNEADENRWWSFSTGSGTTVSTTVNPTTINVGNTGTVTLNLNNVPAEGGYSSAEFTCTYNPTLVQVSNTLIGSLFGADPVGVINDPQNGSLIVAIAGSNGNKAITGGAAFTFNVKALQAGHTSVECASRVSKGDGTLLSLLSTGPATLILDGGTIPPTDTPVPPEQPPGTLAGQVIACKPVTVHLRDAEQQLVAHWTANPDGSFSEPISAGTYAAYADAKGFLWARTINPVIISSGETTTMPTVTLLAGDIFKHDILIEPVIDEWDALTIGINYGKSTPTDADLNCDEIINVLDLELLAANYRRTGAVLWP